MSEEILSWMRKAGCIQISYGVESGSEKIRASLNKKITTSEIEKAFAITIKYGILARAYFIYGCPGENRETIQKTIDLIEKIRPLVIHFFVLSLFPGTALYAEYKQKFIVTDDAWLNRIEDIKYFETDPQLSRELVTSFGQKLITKFYEQLPAIVDAIELIDKKEFYPLHADFCSRLAMTLIMVIMPRKMLLRKKIKSLKSYSKKLYNIILTRALTWDWASLSRRTKPIRNRLKSFQKELCIFRPMNNLTCA
jgi:radical SAM superfamily enzyme YgiQ (UPF0313 family)